MEEVIIRKVAYTNAVRDMLRQLADAESLDGVCQISLLGNGPMDATNVTVDAETGNITFHIDNK